MRIPLWTIPLVWVGLLWGFSKWRYWVELWHERKLRAWLREEEYMRDNYPDYGA